MKKVVVVLCVAILIVSGTVGFMYWRATKRNKKTENIISNEINYGNRGNISEAERVKFLSKNDEYLTGMIGIPVSTDLKLFSNNDMIRFALNVAVRRYSEMLVKKSNKDGAENYIVPVSVVNSITNEYFGVKDVSFDPDTNEYYSKANKAFVLGEIPATTLYYYPVYMESIGVEEVYGSNLQPSNGTSIAEGEEKGNEKYTKVTVDSIFISDDLDIETIESAKYAGKYDEKNVDSNVKFVFNAKGKLVAYQYN